MRIFQDLLTHNDNFRNVTKHQQLVTSGTTFHQGHQVFFSIVLMIFDELESNRIDDFISFLISIIKNDKYIQFCFFFV